jgi:hypothetical protein
MAWSEAGREPQAATCPWPRLSASARARFSWNRALAGPFSAWGIGREPSSDGDAEAATSPAPAMVAPNALGAHITSIATSPQTSMRRAKRR